MATADAISFRTDISDDNSTFTIDIVQILCQPTKLSAKGAGLTINVRSAKPRITFDFQKARPQTISTTV